MSVQDNLRVAKEIYDAFNNRNFVKGKNLVDDSAELELVPFGTKFHGKQGYLDYTGLWSTAFPDGFCAVKNIIAGEDYAVVEFNGQGTHDGPLNSPSGEIKATGKKVNVPFCEVFKIRDGKIISVHTYFDTATMLQQLQLMPEKASV